MSNDGGDGSSDGAELDVGEWSVDNVVRSSRRYLAQLLQNFLGEHQDFYFEQLEYGEKIESSEEKNKIIESVRAALADDGQMRGRILKLIHLDDKLGDRRFQIDLHMFPVIEGECDFRDRGDEMLCPHCLLAGECVFVNDLHKLLYKERSLCGRLTNITGVFVRTKWENEVHPTQQIIKDAKGRWTYMYALVAAKYFGSVEKAQALQYSITDLFFGMGLRGKRV